MSIAQEGGPPKVSLIYDPKVRSIAYQVVLCAIILFLAYWAVRNAAINLEKAHIASGLGFWNQTAGFDISQTLIDYSAQAGTYGRAFWVGLLNTLLVAVLGIFFATIVGFIVGIARLSKNWLIGNIATCYVELIRNVPLLLQLLFWYNAVLKALPGIRESIAIPGGGFLNNRGLFLPQPVFLSVGRVAVEKNLEAFLELDLPGTKLVVGDGPARMTLERKYPDAVFLGARHGEELAEIYAAADIFVFPSKTNTFGLVLLEALASGLPVAAFPVTGPRDVIGAAPVGVLSEDLQTACMDALQISPQACVAFAAGHTWRASARVFVDHAQNVRNTGSEDEAVEFVAEDPHFAA